MPRALMLVSQAANAGLRADVAAGRRPRPEYLHLEQAYGVDLLDWSALPFGVRRRSVRGSVVHVAAAMRRLDGYDVVFTDGEHLGIPLGLALRATGRALPHLMLGHHLTTPAKRRVFRALRPQRRISRILVHSRRQIEVAQRELGLQTGQLSFVPYFADTEFWASRQVEEERLVVTAGREHRDYATLASACEGLDLRVAVAVGSLHSPGAPWRPPLAWPENFKLLHMLDQVALRDLYARASVVAIPLLNTDFQAGVTTLLEAMSMGKAVVVSATEGQRDIVEDGETGILVPPGDAGAMREAIRRLADNPRERSRMGENARREAHTRFSLDAYASAIASHLEDLARCTAVDGGRAAAKPA